MSHSEGKLVTYANIWARQKLFKKAGETIGGHKHYYDHLSVLASGRARVDVIKDNGEKVSKEFSAPAMIIIRKDYVHDVTALTDDVLWICTFANRDIDGNVYSAENDVLDMSEDSFNAEKITIEE